MAIQALKLESLLTESGFRVLKVRTNPVLPASLAWMARVSVLRSCAKLVLFLLELRRMALQADSIYFLSAFFNFFWWVTCPALLLLFAYRRKVILSARGGAGGRFFAKYKYLLRPLIRRLELVTTPSSFLQYDFVRIFGIKAEVVPNIADLRQLRFRMRYPLRPRLIVSRNLELIYNVACVIRAFAAVHARFPDATLAVAGDGSQREHLEALVEGLGLAHAVTFHGLLPHEQVPALYNASDILINGSNVDNMPGVILEAMACGMPIVTTRAGGIPHMVEHGVTALLVDCNDNAGLASAVLRLLEDAGLAANLATNARRACEDYSPQQVRKVIVPLLNRVVAQDRSVPNVNGFITTA
ncbi:MAG: glycosyltransferase family 4 protein [Bacteroidetes bacterium]|nr:glycosyltransferase family 4 protein [Bacteroidota bacterium]